MNAYELRQEYIGRRLSGMPGILAVAVDTKVFGVLTDQVDARNLASAAVDLTDAVAENTIHPDEPFETNVVVGSLRCLTFSFAKDVTVAAVIEHGSAVAKSLRRAMLRTINSKRAKSQGKAQAEGEGAAA